MNIYHKTSTVLLLSLLTLTSGVSARSTGTSGASFLKIENGARPAAMGGAFCAIADEAAGFLYNPAGSAQLPCREISLSHREWIGDIGSEFIGYVHPLGGGSPLRLGGALNYVHTSGAIRRDSAGNDIGGGFGADYGFLALNAGTRIAPSLMAGVNVKAIRERVESRSATAYAADLGLLYRKDNVTLGPVRLRRASAGLSLLNLGTPMTLYKDSFPLPQTVKAGVGGVFAGIPLTAAIDAEKPEDNDLAVRAGGEYVIGGILALRAGYRFDGDRKAGTGLTAGFGFIHPGAWDYRIDYSFVPSDDDLGNTQMLSLNIRMGRPSQAKVRPSGPLASAR